MSAGLNSTTGFLYGQAREFHLSAFNFKTYNSLCNAPFLLPILPLFCYLFSHHVCKTPCHPKRKGTSVHSCKQSEKKRILECYHRLFGEQWTENFPISLYQVWMSSLSSTFHLMVCKSPLPVIKMIFHKLKHHSWSQWKVYGQMEYTSCI